MSDPSKPTPTFNEHHATHLLEERRELLAQQKATEGKVKRINLQLSDALASSGVKRHQMTTGVLAGALIYMVESEPRQNIKAEKLLLLGVDPTIIAAATVSTPVLPYLRVDAPKVTGDKPAPVEVSMAEQTAVEDVH